MPGLVPPERRAAARGILGAGGSLGQPFYPPFAQIAIGGSGWYASPAKPIASARSLSLGAATLVHLPIDERPVARLAEAAA